MNALPSLARAAAAVSAVALQRRHRLPPPLLPIANIPVTYGRPSFPSQISSWFARRPLTQQTTTTQCVRFLSRRFCAMSISATVSEVGLPNVLSQCPLQTSPPVSTPSVHVGQDMVDIFLKHLPNIDFKTDETLAVPETGPLVSAAPIVASTSAPPQGPPRTPSVPEPITLGIEDVDNFSDVSSEFILNPDSPACGLDLSLDACSDVSSEFILDPDSPACGLALPLDACSDASSEFILNPFSPDRGLGLHSDITNDEPETLNLGFRAQETTFGYSGDDVFGVCGLSGVSPRALELDNQQGGAAEQTPRESSSTFGGDVQIAPSPPARANDELVLNN